MTPTEVPLDPLPAPQGSATRRIAAILRRYWYLVRGSWPRAVEIVFWPMMGMILWGFISTFFMSHSSWVAQASSVLLGGALLWEILFRSQLGMSIGLLEELWSRNMGHLFVTPLRPSEWVAGLTLMSLLRTLTGVVPAALVAVPLLGISVFDMGPALLLFFGLLSMMGWWMGLMIIAGILRYGLGAESLAWITTFLITPIAAVYYPVDVLPSWLQAVAWALPAAPVFEGMRHVLFQGVLRWDLLVHALALNIVYFSLAVFLFRKAFAAARERGSLLNVGE